MNYTERDLKAMAEAEKKPGKRILVMKPGKLPEELIATNEEAQKLVGGYMTQLPAWVIPTVAFGVSPIGREFDPGENAPDNFLSYQHGETIRGPVIFIASDDEGETRDLSDNEVAKVVLLLGKLERLPEIETERPADEFYVVMERPSSRDDDPSA